PRPSEPGVRDGLVPANSAHGIVGATRRVVARFPRGRPGPPRLVHESRDRVSPRDTALIGDKLPRPQIPAPVATGIDEALILAIGYLEAANVEVGQASAVPRGKLRNPSTDLAAYNQHHPPRREAVPRKSEPQDGSCRRVGWRPRGRDVEAGGEAGCFELELGNQRQARAYAPRHWSEHQETP